MFEEEKFFAIFRLSGFQNVYCVNSDGNVSKVTIKFSVVGIQFVARSNRYFVFIGICLTHYKFVPKKGRKIVRL